jgi:hypothetical protein
MLVTALQIHEAIDVCSENRRKFYSQQSENELHALELRELVLSNFFYIRSSSFGWSKSRLVDPAGWYHELNGANIFEVRWQGHDKQMVWYHIHHATFLKPEDTELTKIEDIQIEPKLFEERVPGPTCTNMCVCVCPYLPCMLLMLLSVLLLVQSAR